MTLWMVMELHSDGEQFCGVFDTQEKAKKACEEQKKESCVEYAYSIRNIELNENYL